MDADTRAVLEEVARMVEGVRKHSGPATLPDCDICCRKLDRALASLRELMARPDDDWVPVGERKPVAPCSGVGTCNGCPDCGSPAGEESE